MSVYALALIIASSTSLVNAATISYTFTTTGYPNPSQTTSWGESSAFPKLPVALAHLRDIVWQIEVFSQAFASGVNTTAAPISLTAFEHGTTYVEPSGFFLYLPASQTFTVDPGPFQFSGPIRTATVSKTDVANFTIYLGSGTVPFTVFSQPDGPDAGPSSRLRGAGGSMLPAGINTSGLFIRSSARVTLTYTFDVPEPNTLSQVSIGLLMLVAAIAYTARH